MAEYTEKTGRVGVQLEPPITGVMSGTSPPTSSPIVTYFFDMTSLQIDSARTA